MSNKVPIQIHILYTTSEFLPDRIVIGRGKDILKFGQEDYSSPYLDYNNQNEKDINIPDDYNWYEKQQEDEHKEILALASKE